MQPGCANQPACTLVVTMELYLRDNRRYPQFLACVATSRLVLFACLTDTACKTEPRDAA